MGRWFEGMLSVPPLQSFFIQRSARSLTVLAYHDVSDPEMFEQQVGYVAERFQPVRIEDVHAAVAGERDLPERALLLTFDDGYRSVLETALPIMQRHGVPGVVYVIAGLLDTSTPFWWAEVEALVRAGGTAIYIGEEDGAEEAVRVLKRLPNSKRLDAIRQLQDSASEPAPPMLQLRRDELRALEAGGIAVGNHTLTHPCLHQCDRATVEHELYASQSELEDALGHPPITFAYPNGDHDTRVVEAVETIGFESAFLFDHRCSPSPPPRPTRISRLRVNTATPMHRFKTILSGVHPFLHRLRGGI